MYPLVNFLPGFERGSFRKNVGQGGEIQIAFCHVLVVALVTVLVKKRLGLRQYFIGGQAKGGCCQYADGCDDFQ